MAGTLAIGLLVGSVAKTGEGGRGLANLITLPMAFLSGAFIPLESAPVWWVTVWRVPADGLPGRRHEGPDGAWRGTIGGPPIVILLAFAAGHHPCRHPVFTWDTA